MTTYGTVNLDDGHILIIDDQEVLRNHIRRVLGSSGSFTKFTEAADGLEGFQKLLQQLDSIDVIICDVEMPQIDGFKFLGLKQSKPELVEVPVIMVTTRGESEHRLRGLQLCETQARQIAILRGKCRQLIDNLHETTTDQDQTLPDLNQF